MATSSPSPSQCRATRVALLVERIRTSAANQQVLHALPFAAVDDWALECFFDPIDNENELSTPEQDRLRAIRLDGFARTITETLDEVREIALASWRGRISGGQRVQAEHAESSTGAGREMDESVQRGTDGTPLRFSMDPSSSDRQAPEEDHMKPEDEV